MAAQYQITTLGPPGWEEGVPEDYDADAALLAHLDQLEATGWSAIAVIPSGYYKVIARKPGEGN